VDVAIIDVGLGNCASVKNMIDRLGATAFLATTPDEVGREIPLVLPGVGAFDAGVVALTENGWFEYLRGLPGQRHLLGICLGMQLLGQSSTEGRRAGLGRVQATCSRLDESRVRVPHMGWNEITITGTDPVMSALPEPSRFYFSHSYAMASPPDTLLATADYGGAVTAAIRKENTYGVQFHPEKSHRFGMAFLSAWLHHSC
jgi:glutamine amidotransferase